MSDRAQESGEYGSYCISAADFDFGETDAVLHMPAFY